MADVKKIKEPLLHIAKRDDITGMKAWLIRIAAIVIGLLVMLPIMGIVISLLVSADAAFDGMMQVLPKINFWEAVFTVPIGVGLAIAMIPTVPRLIGLSDSFVHYRTHKVPKDSET